MTLLNKCFPSLFEPELKSNIRQDLAGGLAAMLVSLPQNMAYGILAVSVCGPGWTGLGILAGLYSGVLAGALAVVLGGNPVVVSGPRAATVLLLGGLVGHLLGLPGMTVQAALAFAGLAVVAAGLLQVGFGLLRLGRLADFIPHPVVAGFLNGSALLILLSQLGPITGTGNGEGLAQFAAHIEQVQPGTLALGIFTVLTIIAALRFLKKIQPMLVGVLLGTAVYHLVGLLGFGDLLGGTIPGLPSAASFQLTEPAAVLSAAGTLNVDTIKLMLPVVLSIAALSSLDAAMASVAIDQRTLRRSDTNRELIGQGLASALSGVLGLLPISGGLARTSALVQAGGRTALAPILCAAISLVVTIGLAPLVSLLPEAVVAGLLVMVGVDLIDKWTIALIGRVRWPMASHQTLGDLLAIAVVVGTALVFDLVTAVGVGTLVSLFFFVLRMSRSPVRRFYRASALQARFQGDSKRLAFIERHGDAIAVIELEGSLFFGSAARVAHQAEILQETGVSHFVLDLKRVTDVDSTAARMIEKLHAAIKRRGGCLALAYVETEKRRQKSTGQVGEERRLQHGRRRLWHALEQSGCLAALGYAQICPDLESAVVVCEKHLAAHLTSGGTYDLDVVLSPPILRGLDKAALRSLRSYVTRLGFSAGETVVRQNDTPDGVYFVVTGRMEVNIDLPRTDRKLRVQTLSEGTVFGEMAVIDPKPRSANVVALEPSVCYRLSAQAVERLKREQPEFAFRLIENIAFIFAERLRASNVLVAELGA